MAKRIETLSIEEVLRADTQEKRIYGCEEVTIGFFWSGGGKEHVDFMTMDSKGIFRCYEIKVTMADLKSKAKKSFYGHYNYLVITEKLWKEISESGIDLSQYGIPDYVGITICVLSDDGKQVSKWNRWRKPRSAKKQNISEEDESMLKESLVRTMYYKMEKYRRISDGSAYTLEKQEKAKYKSSYEKLCRKHANIQKAMMKAQKMLYDKYGVRFPMFDLSDELDWEESITEFMEKALAKKLHELSDCKRKEEIS